MSDWKNLDELEAFHELEAVERVNLREVMSGENGAERVRTYHTDMAAGMATGKAWFKVPSAIKIVLTGKMPKWKRAGSISQAGQGSTAFRKV